MKYITLESASEQVKKRITGNEIFLSKEANIFLSLKEVFSTFFFSEEVYGTLFETSDLNIYVLKDTQGIFYTIMCRDYFELILQHYIFALKTDIIYYKKHCLEKKISFSDQILINFQEQLLLYEKQCNKFIQKYSPCTIDNYHEMQEFRQLINQYAGLRTQLLGNAESLHDSQNSNSFLLLDNTDLFDANYARVKNWMTKEYEKYIKNIIGLDNLHEYNLSLTSSGMQAITMVVRYLFSRKKKKILLYGIVYFETIRVLENYFGIENLIYFDPNLGTKELPGFLEKHSIDGIFLDSSTISFHSHNITPNELQDLYRKIENTNTNIDIIFDTTTKYLYHHKYMPPQGYKNTLIYVGSLGKYLYGGIDGGFGGYIVTPQYAIGDTYRLFSNSGVGIKSIDAFKIPLFSRHIHKSIAQKIQNTLHITEKLWQKQKDKYPNISTSFSSLPGKNKEDFFGNSISIGYLEDTASYNTISQHKDTIIESIFTIAKQHKIDLSYSTSYGFYNTRISTFNCQGIEAIPIKYPCYIRLSIGYTSNTNEVLQLINIIAKVLLRIQRNVK